MTVYCFDIDGTICTSVEDGNYEEAKPYPERIAKINKLFDEGHYIIYQTARGMGRYSNMAQPAIEHFHDFTEAQLVHWGCHYHELHLGKPSADHYIDDKGINDGEFFGV